MARTFVAWEVISESYMYNCNINVFGNNSRERYHGKINYCYGEQLGIIWAIAVWEFHVYCNKRIKLLNAARKVKSKMINERLRTSSDATLLDGQAGFISGRSFNHVVFAQKHVILKRSWSEGAFSFRWLQDAIRQRVSS